MKYAVVKKNVAESFGISPKLHKSVGDSIVVNENELLKISDNIEEAAQALGGVVLSFDEIEQIITNKNKEL